MMRTKATGTFLLYTSVLLLTTGGAAWGQASATAFTYQGQLEDLGVPVNATCALQFSLWDDPFGAVPANQVGTTLVFDGADAVEIVNGLFTVELDFGAGAFDGNERWLEVAVRCSLGSDFVILDPRQRITGAPFAAYGAVAPWTGLIGVPSDITDGDQDSNASTLCSGAGVFLDGDGNCVTGGDGYSLDAEDGDPIDALSVDSQGRVRIGTDTALATLTVEGNVRVLSHPSSYSMIVDGTVQLHDQLIVGDDSLPGLLSPRLRVRYGVGIGHGAGVLSENAAGTSIGAGISTGDDNLDLLAGGLSRIRILTDGRVGIGTLTPGTGEKLTVEGVIRSRTGGFKFPDGSLQITAANDHHSLDADDGSPTDALYVSSLGFVGIGTSTPSNPLTVHGSTYLQGKVEIDTATTVTGLTVRGRTELQGRLTVGDDIWLTAGQGVYVLNGAGMKTTADNDLDFITGTSNTQRMRITANGRVGIGTTAPQDKLDLLKGNITLDTGADGATALRFRYNGALRWTWLYRSWAEDRFGLYNESLSRWAISFRTDTNGVGINREDTIYPLQVGTGSTNGNGAYLSAGGVWSNGSDRGSKCDFEPVDRLALLEKVVQLPITSWRYKGEENDMRHVGPMAQDFYAAFALGDSDKHIGTLDADGIALAAIQGLHQQLAQKEQELEVMRRSHDAQVEELQSRIAAMDARLRRLENLASSHDAPTRRTRTVEQKE